MLTIHKFKGVRKIDQEGRHKSFCNADEVHGSVSSLGGTCGLYLISRVEHWRFQNFFGSNYEGQLGEECPS